MALASERLRSDFDQAAVLPRPDLRGRERELALISFLNQHLPKRFSASSGYALHPSGAVSDHLDVIVFDALNSPVYRPSEQALMLPSDNVAIVIEVKSELTAETFKAAMEHLAKVKQLPRSQPQVRYQLLGGASFSDWVAEPQPPGSIQPWTFLFAYKSVLSLDEIGHLFYQHYTYVPPGSQVDFVVVLDLGLVSLSFNAPSMNLPGHTYVPGTFPSFPEGEVAAPTNLALFCPAGEGATRILTLRHTRFEPGTRIAVGARELGLRTLDAMMRFMTIKLSGFRSWITCPGGNWGTLGTGEKVTLWPLAFAVDPLVNSNVAEEARRGFHAMLHDLEPFRKKPIAREKGNSPGLATKSEQHTRSAERPAAPNAGSTRPKGPPNKALRIAIRSPVRPQGRLRRMFDVRNYRIGPRKSRRRARRPCDRASNQARAEACCGLDGGWDRHPRISTMAARRAGRGARPLRSEPRRGGPETGRREARRRTSTPSGLPGKVSRLGAGAPSPFGVEVSPVCPHQAWKPATSEVTPSGLSGNSQGPKARR